MKFVLTNEDIKLWSSNFFGIEMTVEYAHDDYAGIQLNVPATGLRKLLFSTYLNHRITLHIEKCEPSCITAIAFRGGDVNEELLRMFVGYANHFLENELLEQLPFGRIKIHLDEIWGHIVLQSARFDESGLVIELADNEDIHEELRMLQMLLRAGYTHVRIKAKDSEPTRYWFADDIMGYTLVMADHPADIRLCGNILVPTWMGFDHKSIKEILPENTPNLHVSYDFGYIIVSLPVTIAEPMIDASTIERNCKRMRGDITDLVYTILSYEQPRDLSVYTEEQLIDILGALDSPSPESRRVNSIILSRHLDEEHNNDTEPLPGHPF